MSEYGDVSTLIKLNQSLAEPNKTVEEARIHNPAAEVKDALKDFAVTRLKRVEDDAAFTDTIKATLRQRLPEATFGELMQLLRITSESNNQMSETLVNMFQSQNSDKTVIERLEDNGVESKAAQMYANMNDKKTIQAMTYLGSIIDKISGGVADNNLRRANFEEIDSE